MVVANASNAAVVSDALAERLAGTRAVLDDHSLATGLVAVQGPRSVDVLGPLTDVDLGALRYYAIAEGHVAGIPAQVARTGYTGRGRLRGLRRDGPDRRAVGRAARRRCARADGLPVGLGRPRHAPPRGRHAPVRQRARPRDDALRRRAGPGRQARQGRPTSSVGPRSSGSPPTVRGGGSSGSSSRAAGSPATATRSTPASGGPASSPAGPSRRPSACPSPWPTSRRPTASPAPSWTSRSATRASPRASSPCRSTGGAPDVSVPTDLRYTRDHEWVRVDGDEATVGITRTPPTSSGDIVFVELPDAGRGARGRPRRSASSSRSRPSATCSRRCPARSPRSTTRSPGRPSWSTATPTARAG